MPAFAAKPSRPYSTNSARCWPTITFRVGAEDARLLAAHLGLKPDIDMSGLGYRSTDPVEQLVRLPDFHAIARTLRDDMATDAVCLAMLAPPPPVNRRSQRLIENSRARFGKRRTVVERKVAGF